MAFLSQLVATDDGAVDSVIVGGLLALFVLSGLQIYDVVGMHHDFGPINFATASAAILGSVGGAKRLRDGARPPDGDH